MKLKYILICLLTISFFVGCKSKKKLARKSQTEIAVHQKVRESTSANTKKNSAITNSTIEYIKRYKDIAMEEMKIFKIPASITLAQGILESSSGNSLLTKKSNNHFGIKCHKGWKGKKVYHDDDEKGECFRVYKHPDNSFKDHSKFLATRSRYAKLFKLKKGDYVKWAKGLSEAGYATDRRYPAKLIALIEKYDLHKYDTEVLGKPFKKLKTKNVSNHIVSKGDTLYSISKKYGLTVDELKKLNGLNSNNITIGQTLILK
ncbi:glucosaminidase domain-containing protein [Lutibacter sp.]